MCRNLLTLALIITLLLGSCASSSHNKNKATEPEYTPVSQVDIPAELKPTALTDLARTEDGAFVLAPGFYETEYKTYCLQPGTPDPSPRDAYLQAPISGYRKEIVETVLENSRQKPEIPQRNVQLLLWSIVSGSDYNKLSPTVRADASQLLTQKQIFELKGGVMGIVKQVSYSLPSNVLPGNSDVKRLFDMGTSTYESFEQIAVLRESSKLKKADFKNDQWYKQKQNFYVRYFPVSYQKVKIQVYVPDGVVDSTGKLNGEYVLYRPTGQQAVPANSNSQRLGIGGPVFDIVRTVIKISQENPPPKMPAPKRKKQDPKTQTEDKPFKT